MSAAPKLLDVVALIEDRPTDGLVSGQVGTIVEVLDAATMLVEFSDDQGEPYAVTSIAPEKLLVLRYEPVAA